MRRLKQTFQQKPAFKDWLPAAARARDWVLEQAGKAGGKGTKKTGLPAGQRIKWSNRSYVWKDHKSLLIEEYDGKCMYCEGDYTGGSHEDAEHFAPKGKITQGRQAVAHPGYYWLAFEWQNILLACSKCNANHPDGVDGPHDGKLNEYPVKGPRRNQPNKDPEAWWQEALDEKPGLLHPYFDHPERHFGAKPGGFIYGKTGRGRKTVDTCDLNRPRLRKNRRTLEKHVRGRIIRILERLEKEQEFDDLLFEQNDEFSLYLNLRLEQDARLLHEGSSGISFDSVATRLVVQPAGAASHLDIDFRVRFYASGQSGTVEDVVVALMERHGGKLQVLPLAESARSTISPDNGKATSFDFFQPIALAANGTRLVQLRISGDLPPGVDALNPERHVLQVNVQIEDQRSSSKLVELDDVL